MSRGRFIVTFVARCAAEGVDPVERAKEEICRLDAEIKKIGELHRDRSNFVALLEQYGDTSLRLQRTVPPKPEVSLDDDTEVAKETRRAIIRKIEANGAVTVEDLLAAIGSSFRDEASITRSVKFLMDRDIVVRDGSPDNRVKPGPNWGEGVTDRG